jgi:hypothetical protein
MMEIVESVADLLYNRMVRVGLDFSGGVGLRKKKARRRWS